MYKIETKKDKIKLVRTILEAAVLLLVLFAAIRALSVTSQYHPYDPADPAVVSGQDAGFVVVSYFGVDRQGTDTLISTRQLDEQLKALHDLGYVTISQQDIINYYHKKTPLPDKALFLLFEDGRRDTALFAQKILEKYNYCATILSYADKFAEKDPKFLSPADLQDLQKSGFWELGTNGYRLAYINAYDRYDRFLGQMTSDEFVRVNQYLGRDYNHYLMDYIRDENRIPAESRSAMESRITQDYLYMQQIYTQELGTLPQLYCLMHSNTGRYGNTASVSAVNAENIEDLFEMNFNRDGYALNNRESSIYDLTRIQPQARWNTNHLLMRIWDDLPESDKAHIVFVRGENAAANRDEAAWQLEKGAMESKKDRIILTSLPQGEGVVNLQDESARDVTVTAELLGNKIGSQTIYLRTNTDRSQYVAVALQNNHLVVTECVDGAANTLFEMDLHDLTPVGERTSVEEDDRAALAAEYTMRGRFAASSADSLVFYAAAQKARAQQADSVADGAEEYVPEIQINEQGDTKLTITLTGSTLQVSVGDTDVTGALETSVTAEGGVALGASWGGWGYSQRNVADDVYDGVFKDLTITDQGETLYTNTLNGWQKFANAVADLWNRTLNWAITNL